MPVTSRPFAQARALLDAALEQEIGIAIPCSSQAGATQLLISIRKGEPKYAGLIFFSPNNGGGSVFYLQARSGVRLEPRENTIEGFVSSKVSL